MASASEGTAVALQGRQHLRRDLRRLQDAPHFGHDGVLDHSGGEPRGAVSSPVSRFRITSIET
jgi:hypothetical protein